MYMIFRKLFKEEWKSPDDAFYCKPPIHPLRGSYWCWLIQGDKSKPKIWIHISFFGVKNTINGVTSHDGYSDDGKLRTLATCWYVKNNKLIDYFLENSVTTVNKKSFTCKTESGFIIKLENSLPNYTLSLEKDGKKILKCISKGSDLNVKPKIYEKDYNTKSFLSKDKKSYWMVSETIRLPIIAKSTNLFTDAKCNFFGEKFNGLAYAEKYHGIGPPVPWKYMISDLKDGSRLRFFWVYQNFMTSKHDLSFTFDCVAAKKKYFFENLDNVEFIFLDKNKRNPKQLLSPKSKYIKIKGSNDEDQKIEILAEIVNGHVYRYDKWILHSNYNQFILKLKEVKVFDGKKKIKINTKDAHSYGEFVDLKV